MAAKPKVQAEPAAPAGAASMGLEAWKQQFETSLRVIEAITEGAVKLRESQLKAAVDAHACAAAAHDCADKAREQGELLSAETEWMRHSVEQSAAYWRSLFATALQTQANVLQCLTLQSPLGAVPVDYDAPAQAMLKAVDTACTQWVEASKRTAALLEGSARPSGN